MKKFGLIIILVGFTGCASLSLEQEDGEIYKGIADNDVSFVNNQLSSEPDLSSRPYLLDAAVDPDIADENINRLAIFSSETKKKCRDEIVSLLLSKKIIPTNYSANENRISHFSSAIQFTEGKNRYLQESVKRIPQLHVALQNKCYKIAGIVAPYFQPKEVLKEVEPYLNFSSEAILQEARSENNENSCSHISQNEQNFSFLHEGVAVMDYLHEDCLKNKDPSMCKAYDQFTKDRNQLQQLLSDAKTCNEKSVTHLAENKKKHEGYELAEKQHEGSADQIKESACNAIVALNSAKAIQNHEYEIGKASGGYVNKVNLYEAGQIKVINEHDLVQAKQDYLKKTKRSLDLHDCKKFLKDLNAKLGREDS